MALQMAAGAPHIPVVQRHLETVGSHVARICGGGLGEVVLHAQIQNRIWQGDGSLDPENGDPSAAYGVCAHGNCHPRDGDDAYFAGRGPG